MKEPRYLRNGILEDEEQEILKAKKVAVIGCGGLGGYVVEMLARLGVGHLVLCDGDSFDETNLNRQLLAIEDNLGKNKAMEAEERARQINSSVRVDVHPDFLTLDNGRDVLAGCDLVIDAVDGSMNKILIENICEEMNLPFVHGAIAGWFGHFGIVFPGDGTLKKLYKGEETVQNEYGNPSFTPALIASLQVSEATKYLLNKGEVMSGRLMMVDLFHNEVEYIEV